MRLPVTIPPHFYCTHCGATNDISPGAAEAYFLSAQLSCRSCNQTLNWWETVVKTITDNFMYTQAFGFVGAQTTVFKFNLPPEKTTVIHFHDFGVPDEARILAVNYTPYGRLFPLQWHSNQLMENSSMWGGAGQPHTVHLWPASPDGQKAETEISCMITWAASPPDDPAMSNLVDAFAAYAAERHTDAVIPANVAVETTVTRVLDTYLSRFVSRKKVKNFLRATYDSQLNVVLPILAHLNHCSVMPEIIRDNLNRLRSLRHQLAHRGQLEEPLQKDQTAELLAAATLGTAYIRYFERTVT